ncbi:MAG: succinate dehydrogenase, hydrophobic membrane anchor protein [Alphaproteobacteria bacterium]
MKKNKDSIRTPLGRARGLGSSKEGTHHWWMQRVTSIALLPLSLYWLFQLKHITETDHGDFTAWLHQPVNGIAAVLFIIASFYHAMLGVQVIIEDYVHGEGAKIVTLLLNKLAFFTAGAVCIFAVLYINFAPVAQAGN